jgi:hypothetical protein
MDNRALHRADNRVAAGVFRRSGNAEIIPTGR